MNSNEIVRLCHDEGWKLASRDFLSSPSDSGRAPEGGEREYWVVDDKGVIHPAKRKSGVWLRSRSPNYLSSIALVEVWRDDIELFAIPIYPPFAEFVYNDKGGHDCRHCKQFGREHKIENVSDGVTDRYSRWGYGIPKFKRRCTGCGVSDGPWVDVPCD